MAAPNANGNQTLDSILEDLTTPSGKLVSSIFSASYTDTDNDKFIGVIVTSNLSQSSEGEWQWSSDGGVNWNNISTSLSETEGLFVSEKDYIRFLPAANFNGSPGDLNVRLIDTNLVYSSSTPITNPFNLGDVGETAAPFLVDIDSDSDFDAFIGNADGELYYFQNIGTNSNPNFTTSLVNPFGLSATEYNDAKPSFVDLDNDGDFDVFIGNETRDFYYLENTGSADDPNFSVAFENPFGLVDNRNYRVSSPEFVDIDNDGDLDLFVGASRGDIFYFENEGTSVAPQFKAAVTNPFNIDIDLTDTTPSFADLDLDDDFDLFIGTDDGSIQYLENVGTANDPDFAASIPNPFGISNVANLAKPAFVDIDGDTDLDLFIGQEDGNTIYIENQFASGSIIDASTNGGDTAISSASILLSTSVNAVNDAATFGGDTTGAEDEDAEQSQEH